MFWVVITIHRYLSQNTLRAGLPPRVKSQRGAFILLEYIYCIYLLIIYLSFYKFSDVVFTQPSISFRSEVMCIKVIPAIIKYFLVSEFAPVHHLYSLKYFLLIICSSKVIRCSFSQFSIPFRNEVMCIGIIPIVIKYFLVFEFVHLLIS